MTDANEHWDRSWGQEREAEPRTLEHNLADYKCRALDAERERDDARAEVKRLREVLTQARSLCEITLDNGDWEVCSDLMTLLNDSPATSPGDGAPRP